MEKFAIDPRSLTFDKQMRKLFETFFKDKKRTGNMELFVKASILLTLLFSLILVLASNRLPNQIEVIGCVMLGLVVAGIGFNIMHDAVHGSFSNYGWVNKLLSYSLNLLGGYWPIWKKQHNADHHMNTNVNGKDGDIDLGILGRLHPSQKWYWWHKWQHLYLPFIFYPLSYLAWIYLLDFIKANQMGFTFRRYLYLIGSKLIHISVFILFPLMFHTWKEVLIGYFIVTIITGIIISFVFQLAHTVEITEMIDEPEDGIVKSDSVHQLRTTADFATKNKALSWYVGGLNFQVEHHLFYKVSHVHYPHLYVMVKKTCSEQNLPHHENSTLGRALMSHLRQLKKLGKDPKKIAA